jgi:hypothetical protein
MKSHARLFKVLILSAFVRLQEGQGGIVTSTPLFCCDLLGSSRTTDWRGQCEL